MLLDLEKVAAGGSEASLFVKNTLYGKRKIKFHRADSHLQFRQRLETTLPWLKNFSLQEHNLVMAGGCVSALLHHTLPRPGKDFSDVDLFFVIPPTTIAAVKDDHLEPLVAATLNSLGEHLYREWCVKTAAAIETTTATKTTEAATATLEEKPIDLKKMKVFRNLNAVTFYHPLFPPVQVMLTIYRNIEDVLSGFDLGSCSYLFDGTAVSMSELGRSTWINGRNVLNLARRKQNLEKRLATYFSRGFSLQLPALRIKPTFQRLLKCSKRNHILQFHRLIALKCNLVKVKEDGLNYNDCHIEVDHLVVQYGGDDDDNDDHSYNYSSGDFCYFKYNCRSYDKRNLSILQQLNGGADPAELKKYLMAHADFLPGATAVLHFPLTVPFSLLEEELEDALGCYHMYFKSFTHLFQSQEVAKRFVNAKLDCEIGGGDHDDKEKVKEEYLKELKLVYFSDKMKTLRVLDFQVLHSNDFYPLTPMVDKDWYKY